MARALVFLYVAILGGCAGLTEIEQSYSVAVYEQHAETLASIDSWNIKGRMSYRADNKGGGGTIHWSRLKDAHRMDIFGSFGDNRIQISQDQYGASLINSEGARTVGTSASNVLARHSKWDLPIDELIHWVTGSVYGELPAEMNWSPEGRLISLKQSGWTVLYSDYQEFGPYVLPTRFRLIASESSGVPESRDDSTVTRAAEIRLFIRDWGIE